MNRRYLTLVITFGVMLGLYVAGCLLFDRFFSIRVISNLLGDNAFVGVAAVGMTFVILSGGIDLSVGSMVAFTTIFIANNIETHGMHPLLAIALALAFGTAYGAFQGWIIAAFNLPPFLVTLAGLFFVRGIGFIIGEVSVAINHDFYNETIRSLAIVLQNKPRVTLPFTAQCLLIFIIAGTLLAKFTRFGRYVYAIGSNEQSARLMGVPVDRMKAMIYALSGFCAAAGGVVVTFYMQSGNPAAFTGLELDAIASTVIGGTLLTGGVGGVPGTLMGVLILGLIQTMITFHGSLNSWWTKIFIGILLFIFIAIQQLLTRSLKNK